MYYVKKYTLFNSIHSIIQPLIIAFLNGVKEEKCSFAFFLQNTSNLTEFLKINTIYIISKFSM